jgi:hypothetical protein
MKAPDWNLNFKNLSVFRVLKIKCGTYSAAISDETEGLAGQLVQKRAACQGTGEALKR